MLCEGGALCLPLVVPRELRLCCASQATTRPTYCCLREAPSDCPYLRVNTCATWPAVGWRNKSAVHVRVLKSLQWRSGETGWAPQVTLVAESFGGALALRVAAAAPQLLSRLVVVRLCEL